MKNECYPFPDNVKVEFREYCRGCKMCKLEPINFTSGKQIYSCVHSILCDRAYNIGLNIAGESDQKMYLNDEMEV